MLFPTPTFAIFFTLVFALAWAAREKSELRKWLLLAASYVFYGWWDWRFCFLLLGASLIAWLAGLFLNSAESIGTKKWIVGLACTGLLVVLAFFKYYGFFLSSLQDLLFALGLQRDLPFLQIVLPVGISFFTFQAISYVVDVYRGDVRARSAPLDVLLYISLFPQLVAGPIVRAADFLPQLERKAVLTKAMVCSGLTLCIFGLFKKMVIANYLASDLVDPVFLEPGSYSSLVVLLGVYGYAVQIYCDFSGYSDIAIGTALLLGFRFRENFNQPYRATSLQDFWRRWHMSLSQWLRDYLYIPLGGSRGGRWKTYRNLFLTMFLGGLWHGAAWNFVIWGSLHGLWLGMERALGLGDQKSKDAGLDHYRLRLNRKNAPRSRGFRSVLDLRKTGSDLKLGPILGWFITFHVVCAAWVFFRALDFSAAMAVFSALADGTWELGALTWFTLALVVFPLASQFLPSRTLPRIGFWFEQKPFVLTAIAFIVSLLAIVWLSPPGTAPFIYFQF